MRKVIDKKLKFMNKVSHKLLVNNKLLLKEREDNRKESEKLVKLTDKISLMIKMQTILKTRLYHMNNLI